MKSELGSSSPSNQSDQKSQTEVQSESDIDNQELEIIKNKQNPNNFIDSFDRSFESNKCIRIHFGLYHSFGSRDIHKTVKSILLNKSWRHIEILALSNIDFDVLYLIRTKQMSNLKVLILENNNISQFFSQLFIANSFRHVENISFQSNKFHHYDIKDIEYNQWRNLIELNISNNPLGNQAMIYIVNSNWPLMRKIELKQIQITNDGLKVLIKSKWPYLQCLSLKNNPIFNYLSILQKANWPQLSRLDVYFRTSIIDTNYIAKINFSPNFSMVATPNDYLRFSNRKIKDLLTIKCFGMFKGSKCFPL